MTDQQIDALINKANAGSGYMALLKHSECREFARLVEAAERERWAAAAELAVQELSHCAEWTAGGQAFRALREVLRGA